MPEDPAGIASDPRLRDLAERLQAACLRRRLTVALAESCTGGLVAAAITSVSGSSGYFLGGIVSYADESKHELLGVDDGLLRTHGAVSAQVARAMALGARERFGTDLAASVTGIAGPDGGSAAKPVGLTYLGVADTSGADVRRVVWSGDRASNRLESAAAALELLLERIGSDASSAAGDAIQAGAPTR